MNAIGCFILIPITHWEANDQKKKMARLSYCCHSVFFPFNEQLTEDFISYLGAESNSIQQPTLVESLN